MAEDILEQLKSKEDEMEAFINDARRKAAAIVEAALKKAKDIRNAKMKESEVELAGFIDSQRESARLEAQRIETDALAQAQALRQKGEAQKGKAVETVLRLINEGLGDR